MRLATNSGRRISLAALIIAVFLTQAASAQQLKLPAAATEIDAMPFKIPLTTIHVDVAPDGTVVESIHREVQILTAGAVASMSTKTLNYDSQIQNLNSVNAYTLKPDGRKILASLGTETSAPIKPSDTTSIQLPTVQAKIINFSDVAKGDTLVYDEVITSKPQIASNFSYTAALPPMIEIDKESIEIVAPKAMPLYVDSYDVESRATDSGNNKVYDLYYSNPLPTLNENHEAAVSLYDWWPHATVSSYKTYDELAAVYAKIILPKIAVTPAIQERADKIAAGMTQRRNQAQAIYNWISKNIRYVAIEFGSGDIIPRDAESVLASGYGDCKDRAILFSALLKAKNIASEPVLLNAGSGYYVSKAPTLALFNHVINWLPEFNIYADTTMGSSLGSNLPFGVLPFSEYGKSALHIGERNNALRAIPVLNEDQSNVEITTVAKLGDDGLITARSATTAIGPASATLREMAQAIVKSGPELSARYVLARSDLSRAQGRFLTPQFSISSPQATIRGSYTAWQNSGNSNVEDFRLLDGLRLISPFGSNFVGAIGDESYRDADPVPCFSGNESEEYSLSIPAGRRLSKLPQDTIVNTRNLSYLSHWSMDGRVIKVLRKFHAHFTSALCTGEIREQTVAAFAKIRRDYRTKISLISAQKFDRPSNQ